MVIFNCIISDNLVFKIVDNAAIICGSIKNIDGELIIPKTLGDYPVASIGGRAFYGYSGLTNVNIPEGVTSIGESAFSGCTGLTSVTIPESVTDIGVNAFYGCDSLSDVMYNGTDEEWGIINISKGNDKLIIAYIGAGEDSFR